MPTLQSDRSSPVTPQPTPDYHASWKRQCKGATRRKLGGTRDRAIRCGGASQRELWQLGMDAGGRSAEALWVLVCYAKAVLRALAAAEVYQWRVPNELFISTIDCSGDANKKCL